MRDSEWAGAGLPHSSARVLGPAGRSGAAPRLSARDLTNWQIVFVLLAFAVVWLVAVTRFQLSAPDDNIEQLTWVRALEWGYYKHPPLPTWLLWLPVRAVGIDAGSTYLLGAACTLAAMATLWHLLKGLRGRRYANLALLAMLCITYYNGRIDYYNHEVVLMLCTAISAWACWHAFSSGRLRWWITLGAAIGLGALAKYQIAVSVACVLAFGLGCGGWRDPRQRTGALAAVLVALLIFAPHVEWLRAHDFGPVRYAIDSSLGAELSWRGRALGAMHWLADQLFNRAMPAWLLLAAALRGSRSSAAASSGGADAAQPFVTDRRERLFLQAWGGVPLVFMPAVATLSGSALPLHWGTSFLFLAVPAAMELVPRRRWNAVNPRATLKTFVVVQVLLLLVASLTSPHGLPAAQARGWQAVDSVALARRLQTEMHASAAGTVRVIAGPAEIAGALALELPQHPLVLIDGRFDWSPWVEPELVRRCGMLRLTLNDPASVGEPLDPSYPGLRWQVVPPAAGARPCVSRRSRRAPGTRGRRVSRG